jgi:beta-phosphoglucomutase-like phosphatase (HAD superfamily)
MSEEAAVTISRRDFDATIFDLDGVLTDTTRLHAAAWKSVFDALLQQLAERQGRKFRPFDIDADYLAYVDGRPRYDGVRTFLSARGIVLPKARPMIRSLRKRSTRSACTRRIYFGRRCRRASTRRLEL